MASLSAGLGLQPLTDAEGHFGPLTVKLSLFDSLIACQTIVVSPKPQYQTRSGSRQVKPRQRCDQSGLSSCFIRTSLQEALKLIEHVSELHVPDNRTSCLTSTDASPHPWESRQHRTGWWYWVPALEPWPPDSVLCAQPHMSRSLRHTQAHTSTSRKRLGLVSVWFTAQVSDGFKTATHPIGKPTRRRPCKQTKHTGVNF